jgi:hypothetical protein
MAHYSEINNVDNIGSSNHFNILYSMFMNVLKGNKLSNYYSFMVGNTELCEPLQLDSSCVLKHFLILIEIQCIAFRL